MCFLAAPDCPEDHRNKIWKALTPQGTCSKEPLRRPVLGGVEIAARRPEESDGGPTMASISLDGLEASKVRGLQM